MSDAEMSDAEPQGGLSLGPVLIVCGLIVVAVLVQRSADPPEGATSPDPLPPLLVEGWINTDEPVDKASLVGKVVAIDFWAIWCGPCRAEMPNMADLHRRFSKSDDFVLLGLTGDPIASSPQDLAALEEYVASVDGFDWPVAHGARPMFDALGIEYLPTLIVFNREGRAVWRGHSVDGFSEAIREELRR